MGWDSLTGIGMSFVAVAFGFTAATFNPFNVITVQKLAGLPIFSGLWLRLIVFVLVYATLTGFLILYAKKIEKHPEKSPAYKTDAAVRERYPIEACREALAGFNGLLHRMEFVANVAGVDYYNDSISTIPEATIRAVGSIPNTKSALFSRD